MKLIIEVIFISFLLLIAFIICYRAFYGRFWWTCNSLKEFFMKKGFDYSSKLIRKNSFLKFIKKNSKYNNYFMTHIASSTSSDDRKWNFASAIMSKDGLKLEIPKFRFLEWHDSCCYISVEAKQEIDLFVCESSDIYQDVLQKYSFTYEYNIDNKKYICLSSIQLNKNYCIELEKYLRNLYIVANKKFWIYLQDKNTQILTNNDFMKYYRDSEGLSADKKINYLIKETNKILQIINITLDMF